MSQADLTHIPGRSHYSRSYFQGNRIFSYAHQIKSLISFEPNRVLEIGVGAGVVSAALRAMGITVSTVDIQPELKPDIVASVTGLPIDDGAFDVGLCCQVLEHLPFECFVPAIKELLRVARKGVVISLPDVSRRGFISAKLPKIPEFRWSWRLPHLRPLPMPKQRLQLDGHYWEIGYKGFPLSRIMSAIHDAGGAIASTWRVPELPWHRFFVLKSR